MIFTLERDAERHICIPDHKELSLGTLNDLLGDMAAQLAMTKPEIIRKLFPER